MSGQFSRRAGGFSLIELMVVLAVLAIALLLAGPAFTDLIRDNRLVSSAYGVRATLNLARSEALSRRDRVVVCASNAAGTGCTDTTNWSGGYIALMGDGVGATVDAANPGLSRLHWENKTNPAVTVNFTPKLVVFDTIGSALGSAGTFIFCDVRGASKARGLIITNAGMVAASVDSDANGVVEDGAGNDVSC
jgi:type IV fimbrial biogenesis protein FimT